MKFNGLQSKKQKGFTLIEIGIVLFVVGILVALFLPQFTSGIKDSGKATALYSTSQKIVQQWSQVSKDCGVSTTIASNPLPDTGKVVLDAIANGTTDVAAAYDACYTGSNVRPMGDVLGTSTTHAVQGFTATLADGTGVTAGKIGVSYAAVPDAIVSPIVQKYGSGVTTLAASDATNTTVQYGTATGGARTVTVFVQP